MIIPLRHESNRGRRWPYVTIAIIVLNVLVFLVTHGRFEEEAARLAEIQSRTLRLAAVHPDASLTPSQQELVNGFRRSQTATWDRLASGEQTPGDLWESKMSEAEPDQINAEMADLGRQLDEVRQHSQLSHFAFFPRTPRCSATSPPISCMADGCT